MMEEPVSDFSASVIFCWLDGRILPITWIKKTNLLNWPPKLYGTWEKYQDTLRFLFHGHIDGDITNASMIVLSTILQMQMVWKHTAAYRYYRQHLSGKTCVTKYVEELIFPLAQNVLACLSLRNKHIYFQVPTLHAAVIALCICIVDY